MNQSLLLAIESSCDETSAAVLCDGVVVSLLISSQREHNAWGGVVPELASRAHVQEIAPIVLEAMRKAGIGFSELRAIAVTNEPGLVGSLLVGLNVAKGIATTLGIPLLAVHHIEAHLLSVLLDNDDVEFPYVGLIVSGGHTVLYAVDAIGSYRVLGATRDDAAGEAFDKGAKLLGLAYPGGPVIDRLARGGDRNRIEFPRALMRNDDLDFSFSGLKTSLRYYLRDHHRGRDPVDRELADLCASYQEAIVDVLVEKSLRAARSTGITRIALVGGVAANSRLRERMRIACQEQGYIFYTVHPRHGTDNAAMIGIAGWHSFKAGVSSPLTVTARASTIRSRPR